MYAEAAPNAPQGWRATRVEEQFPGAKTLDKRVISSETAELEFAVDRRVAETAEALMDAAQRGTL